MATLLDTIELDSRLLCDVEMLLSGAFAPLNGFLCQPDYESVLDNCRLSTGEVWPMPIVLPIAREKFKSLFGEDLSVLEEFDAKTYLRHYTTLNYLENISIDLTFRNEITNELQTVARLVVQDLYEPDCKKECMKIFQSCDRNHTYIDNVLSRDGHVFYIGGRVEKVDPIVDYDFHEYRSTPQEIQEYAKNFNAIVGFQTRNPMHNCHYELTKIAMNTAITQTQSRLKNSKVKVGLVLQPIVGVTQPNDVDYRVRVRCYKHLLQRYRKDGINARLCLLKLSMRMAGPREALWHALIRKNYGCTHFVVGRDHAGPSVKKKNGKSYFGAYEAHNLIKKFEDEIGIKVIMSQMLVYSHTLQSYIPITDCPDTHFEHLSGTELRKRLRLREPIPEWFTMSEISRELHRYYASHLLSLKNSNGPGTGGVVFYFIGLSGAGKSTLSNAFAKKLEEIYDPRIISVLDGDEIRTNLSAGLGFSREDRSKNVRRIGYVADRLARSGGIVLCANIAPFQEDRDWNRALIEKHAKYIEVYVKTSIDVCEDRDVKGLYKKARTGVIPEFTGISSPFDYPKNADIEVIGDGGEQTIHDTLNRLLKKLKDIE